MGRRVGFLGGNRGGNSPSVHLETLEKPCRRGGRVVEGTGLENRQTRERLEGSNPSPSATYQDHRVGGSFNEMPMGSSLIDPVIRRQALA
jgi:hypothetical protein